MVHKSQQEAIKAAAEPRPPATLPQVESGSTSGLKLLAIPCIVSRIADSFSSQGFWSLVSSPNGATAFFENSNSENTIVTVSDYGIYTFAYNSCGSFDEVEIEFKKDPYANFAVTFYECEQSSSILVDIPQGVDFGYFEFLDGPGNVIIEDESPNSLDFSVDSWGLYDFAYHLCDTFATVTVY